MNSPSLASLAPSHVGGMPRHRAPGGVALLTGALALLAGCDRSGGTSGPSAIRPAVAGATEVAQPPPAQPPSTELPSQGDHVDPAAPSRPEDPEHPLSADPIYDLEAELTDLRGTTIGLDAWRGHPTIVAMFYATCPVACPRLMREITELEASLPADQRAALRVLMVSFDARHDTPATLTETASVHKVDLTRWQLAAAPESKARELAAVLGVKYRALDDGQYFHTSVITLIDGTGRPLARVEGLGRSTEPVRQGLARALAAHP